MRDRNRDQYENDPSFHAVADMAYQLMAQGSLTAEELRRAVMYGAIRYEEQNVRPIIMRSLSDDFLELQTKESPPPPKR